MVGDAPVPLRVLGQIGIEQDDRDVVVVTPLDLVQPALDPYLAIVDDDSHLGRKPACPALRVPGVGQFVLQSPFIECLPKIPLAADEGDAHEWEPEVSSAAQRVPRQHAEPAAVGVDFVA